MAEAVEDLNLPTATVARIIKEAIPDYNIANEAKISLSRAASVFILYQASISSSIAISKGKKTLGPEDILQGLSDTEFSKYVPRLEASYRGYKNAQKEKKLLNAKNKMSQDQCKIKEGQCGGEDYSEEMSSNVKLMECEDVTETEDN